MGSNIAAAELTTLIAASFFAIYWLRGGRAWLLPAGIGHLFIAAIYIYLLVSPVGIPPPRPETPWFTLTLPLCLVAANGFLFFGLLQLLGRAPSIRVWTMGWSAFGLVIVATQAIAGPILAFCLAVASSVAAGPAVGVLLMAQRTLFYVIVGVLLIGRMLFQVVVTYYGAFNVTPGFVELLIYFNLAAVVGDGFGLILIEYDDTRRQLADANRGKTSFLASVSHELRTPLNAIIGFAELIGQQPFGAIDARYQSYAHDILTSGRRLLDVVNQVLAMTEIEARRVRFEFQRVDCVDVVRGALQTLAPRADESRIRIRAAFPPSAVEVRADRRALGQVVLSLVDNAVKFSRPDGTVDVSVSATPDGTVRLVVADEGIGMSPDEVGNIFKPFWQSANVYSRGATGIGLGLAISRKLLEAMGGEIFVESTIGRGSKFTILLPLA